MASATQAASAVAAAQKAAYSVDEFCAQHSISRPLFYVLRKQNRGPRIFKAGNRTLISAEAATEWRRAMETAQATA